MTAYDKLDWHIDGAVSAGLPEENGFVHIGFYLVWLIRHDLHDPAWFPPEHVAAVQAGEMSGSDLIDLVDGTLASDTMTAEGRAFSDARYGRYLSTYAAAFGEGPEYGVEDEPGNEARAGGLIDELYAGWVADGRPEPLAESDPNARASGDVPAERIEIHLPDLAGMSEPEVRAFVVAQIWEAGGTVTEPPDPFDVSHVPGDLARLLPFDVTTPPLRVLSTRSGDRGSALFRRALKRLGVDPRDATELHAMGGDGPETLVVILYAVPGVGRTRLEAEFRSVIVRMPGSSWERRSIAGRRVTWASGDEFNVAFWATAGLVVHIAGSVEDVERAVPRLP